MNRYSVHPNDHMTNDSQHEQMSGIEDIEEIAQPYPALSVIEVTQDIGQRCPVFPRNRGSTGDTLIQPVVMEQVQDHDQKDTLIVIVRHHRVGQPHGGSNRDELDAVESLEILQHGKAQKSDQEGEVDILLAPVRNARFQCIVKGEL